MLSCRPYRYFKAKWNPAVSTNGEQWFCSHFQKKMGKMSGPTQNNPGSYHRFWSNNLWSPSVFGVSGLESAWAKCPMQCWSPLPALQLPSRVTCCRTGICHISVEKLFFFFFFLNFTIFCQFSSLFKPFAKFGDRRGREITSVWVFGFGPLLTVLSLSFGSVRATFAFLTTKKCQKVREEV